MYLDSATRPDIAYIVSILSRFVANPGSEHWRAIERVMCYLVGIMNYVIHYSGDPKVLAGYSDANWISDADELKATSGYVFTLVGGAVSWKSCKQTILTRSTIKAELTALDTATIEAERLRELLMDLPIVEKPISTIVMNCDYQGEQFKGQHEVIQTCQEVVKVCRETKKHWCYSYGLHSHN
jgi:hypothetical protein